MKLLAKNNKEKVETIVGTKYEIYEPVGYEKRGEQYDIKVHIGEQKYIDVCIEKQNNMKITVTLGVSLYDRFKK